MKISYILSAKIDYNKLICNDAGPQYALSMGWEVIILSELKQLDRTKIYAIDNRVSLEETLKLTEIILENTYTKFILKIVDPYFEYEFCVSIF